jgi:hypothetical protein
MSGKKPPRSHLKAMLLGLVLFLVVQAPACQSQLNDPQELVPFLKVELPGWKLAAGYPQAKRMQDKERSFFQAESILSSGKDTITVLIKAGEIAPEVGMFRLFREKNDEKEYCQKTRIHGFEAVEMVSKDLKSAFLFILVGDHCLLTMRAIEAKDTKVLKELGQKIDLPKLAALVK